MTPVLDNQVIDNQAAGRYELAVDGQIVFATYRRDGGVLIIRHVEAPPPLRVTGAAGRLMHGIMTAARAENLKVRPLCSYAAAWLARHEKYRDLLA